MQSGDTEFEMQPLRLEGFDNLKLRGQDGGNSLTSAYTSGAQESSPSIPSPATGSSLDRQADIMINLKLKRLVGVSERLRADLDKERVFSSVACLA